jgi:lipopolysaccharide export system permease protein
MPQIIYRYIILEILPPFWVSLLAFTSIVFLGRMMKVTQMIVVKGVGLVEVLQTCAYLLPYLLVFTLPMAATVGVLLAMTRLSVDQEMTAMKTAGLSYSQLLPPVLTFAVATALVTLGLTVFGSPWGQQATRDLLKEVVKKRADLGIKEQMFNTDFPGMMLFVNQVSNKDGVLEGIFVYDSRDLDNPQTVYAKSGQVSYDSEQEIMQLQLFDGRIVRWGKEPNRWQTVEFQSYQLPLRLFGQDMKGGRSETEMSLGGLWSALTTNPRGSDVYNRAVVELNQRFAMPLGALLLCLMAMPLGLSSGHHSRTWGLVLGLAVFLVYYVVFTASWRLAVSSWINPSLAPWLSNFLFTWVALYLWYRTVRELPLVPVKWSSWSSSKMKKVAGAVLHRHVQS